jgi:hypothetical protein
MLGTPVPWHISAKFNFNWTTTIVKRKRLKCEKLTDTEVTPETAKVPAVTSEVLVHLKNIESLDVWVEQHIYLWTAVISPGLKGPCKV